MSTQYPVLYDRPINKWKVAELKEELKRRNLMIKGLKDDLVKRLDEAIRNERENLEGQGQREAHIIKEPLSELNHPIVQSHSVQIASDSGKNDVKDNILGNTVVNKVDDTSRADHLEATGGSFSTPSYVGSAVLDKPIVSGNIMKEHLSTPIASGEGLMGVFGNIEATKENLNLISEKQDDIGKLEKLESLNEIVDVQVATGSENMKTSVTEVENEEMDAGPTASRDKLSDNYESKLGNECLKPQQMDAESQVIHSSNQVYEISSNLGFQVECKSITTNTLCDYEKTEIKQNLSANNVQLEPEVGRPEMEQSSFHKDASGDESFHSLDDKVPDVKQGFVVETDDAKSTIKSSEKTCNADDVSAIDNIMENKTSDQVMDDNELSQQPCTENRSLEDIVRPDVPLEHMGPSFEYKLDVAASVEQIVLQDNKSSDAKFSEITDITDGEPLEKINLDQSPADDSMEDEFLETKHTDSDFIPEKVGDGTKSTEEIILKDAGIIEALQADIPVNISESSNANTDRIGQSSEKRKFEVEPASDNMETRKRQRRWNDESVKMPREWGFDASLSKMSIQTSASTTSSFGRYNSSSGGETTNERVVPLSSKAPTNSLRIDNFLRPFTLKAVQELLSKTGTFSDFWMDNIKTHCYVTYSSVEEAIETRNALYNLQWPTNGGRLLVVEFVDPKEVKMRLEPPSLPAAPLDSSSALPSQPPARQLAPVRQQETERVTSDPSAARDRLARARSPVAERDDTPIVTLDDLFRKTKATPRIYYLPLTDEEVSAKLARQRK